MQTIIRSKNWWSRRTTLEKCLTLVSVFACIALLGLISGLVFVVRKNHRSEELKTTTFVNGDLAQHGSNITARQKRSPGDDEIRANSKLNDVCLSAECVHTASAVLNKMNPEIEPCDDFYQFACGNYIDKTELQKDEVAIDVFAEILDELHEQLEDLITEERLKSEPQHFRLPNILYKACMNKTLIETLDTKPIQQISDSLGGWPVVVGDSWNSDNSWTWQETVKKFRGLGFSIDYVMDFSINAHLKNSTKRIIDLDQSLLGLNREYLIKGFNETSVSNYYNYMVDIAVLFGAEKEAAKKELRESLQFEIDLARISLSKEKRRNMHDLHNLRSIKQLQATYPYVQWLNYINAILPKGLKVDQNEVVNLVVPSFFDHLGKLLERTKKRAIANYMMWHIHSFSVKFLTEPFRKKRLQYATASLGKQEQEARWKECVDIVSRRLPIAVGSLYVRKYFKQDFKVVALEMFENLREVFSQILNDVQWMDEETKEEAKKKLQSMTAQIGYHDAMLDDHKLEEFYRKLEMQPDKYFESFLNLTAFDMDNSCATLRMPLSMTNWIEHANPTDVNGFYEFAKNTIKLPAAIWKGHLFNSQRPKYMNYGGIGYVIGHEMTHGFDDQGRQFDVNGNLKNWWQLDTQRAFLEKTKCIIAQYGNYTDRQTGLNINGFISQGENIADNGGIKEAYLAYNRWAAKNGEEPRLPGLNYTARQMFWISVAQTWCSKLRKESLAMIITTGFHPPPEFRILGSLRNMEDFSRDFQCPENTPMNPVQKCTVW